MVETLLCAVCGERTAPDVDHVKIAAEHVRLDDRNREELWALHPECYRELVEDWTEPV
jgi:5-methylcytosine-specific restriction endonuclease McrA